MAGLLGKKFPTPVARPMAPFYIAGAIIFYGINSLATTLANSQFYPSPSDPALFAFFDNGHIEYIKTADKLYQPTADEYRNDPRNPNKNLKPAH
ncbi:hypothetical protein E4T48_03051 [Aureobasidium sp. EXF-10727]|nr:hypothetical protein E4T48_03051 [Aureobasidium sp. EXF-10727]